MKGPVTKQLFLGLGLGALLSSCQPARYHARDEGLAALQTLQTELQRATDQHAQPSLQRTSGPFVSPLPFTALLASSAPPHNPYASLTAKDYELKRDEQPNPQPFFSLDALFSYQPLYSMPLQLNEHYSLSDRRQRTLDNAFFPAYQDQERFALEEGWFVHDLKPRGDRDKALDERSLPLGKLGHALRKILEKSNNSFGQVLRGFSGIADGPTQSLFGDDWKTKFNLRIGTKKAGVYLTLKESNAFKFTLGYETSANIGGKEGDAAFFLTFERTIGPRNN